MVPTSAGAGSDRSPRPALAARLAAVALLGVLPLAVRLLPIEHGLPRSYVPDTHAVRNALGMARDQDLVPPAGRYTSYPYLLSYLLLPVYAAEFAVGSATGAWSGPDGFGRRVLEHPEDAALPARILVALLGAATVTVVFRTARAAGLGVGAWVAAWLVATGLLHTHFSVQERPWVPMVLFIALAGWAGVLHARSGRTRHLLACGAAAGLAFATHQAGLFALLLCGLAWAFGPVGWRGRDLVRRLGTGLACVLLFLAVALALGHPYLVRYGRTPAESVVGGAEGAEHGGLAIGGQRMLLRFELDTLARLAKVFFGYDPVLVVLGLIGLWPAFARVPRLRPLVLFALGWAAFFLTYHNDHVRYLLPLAVFLAWPAGAFVERLWAAPRARPALVAVLALPLVLVLRFDRVLSRPDTRADAEQALAALPSGTRVAIDRYGPDVELDRASLERLERLRAERGETLQAREAHRLAMLAAGEPGAAPGTGLAPGIDAVRVEDVLGYDERSGRVFVREELAELGSDPASALRALGATHLLLVDRRPSSPNLLAGLVGREAPILAIDPSTGQTTARECLLPMEMDFPLTALWSVRRPGPRVELFELR